MDLRARTWRVMLRAFLIAGLTTWVGYLGAVAFHPDDGFVLRTDALWRAFGIAAYLGSFGLYLITALALVGLVVRLVRRLCCRGVTSPP